MKYTHTEGQGPILKPRFVRGLFPLAAALLAFALAVPSARAEVLVYEGFSSSDYTAGQSINGIKSGIDSIGLDKVNGWNSGTGVFVAQPNGLQLPDIWKDGTVHGTKDLRAVLYNTTATSATRDNRAQQRKLTCTWPTSGSIYFRFLMQVPQAVLNTTYLGNWNYWIAGLGTEAIEKPTTGDQCNIANGIYMGVRNRNGTLEVAAYVKNPADGATFTKPLFTIDTSKTLRCACIAKIDIGENGNDTLSFYAAPTNTLTTDFEWTFTTNGISLVSGSAKAKLSYLQMIGHYKVNSQYITFDEFIVTTDAGEAYTHASPLEPTLGTISLTRTGAAEYSLSATEDANAAGISYILSDGETVSTNGWQSVAEGGTANWIVSGLTADKTYAISVLATNENGTAEVAAGSLYTGELALGATTDADESGLVSGGVTVARASADPFPLTVNYTISGSAGTEGTTWAAPVAVTIPANELSALLPVVPLMDGDVTSDVTITVALASGNYELPASNAATLTLVNLAAPPGKKTWVATANGNASDGANWLPSGAPTETDEILFDGNFSNARCIWDAAATHTVAAWEQVSTFTGTIELQTTYESGSFAALAITGDCAINGGTVTQTKNEDVQVYRISMTVGGDLTVAAGAQITATGKGYDTCHYPAGSACGVHGGSANDLSLVYGNLKHPVDIGSAGSTSGFKGGGAIHLVVTGDATIDGTLAAQPSTGSTQSDTRYKGHGAGGSIYITAASVAGSGSITAAGYGFSSSWQRPGGAGGRIAVICTTAESLSFPTSKMMCNGSIASYGNTTGAGTIFVKTASQQNGTLIVDNAFAGANFEAFWPTKRGVTPIPAGETWTLDEIQFRRYGVLCVSEGTTLSVPLSGVSSSSDRTAGILYEGGTLNIGSAPYTLTGKWTFQADAPYTFNGDVTVTGGANIGGLRFCGNYTNDFAKCDVTVNGDLTIAADGYASVTMAGPCEANKNGGPFPRHGGQYASLSGNKCYGSVFAPVLPGYFAQAGDHATAGVGGGVLKLTVTGDFVVNGSVSANSAVFSKSSAAAGSVSITAKTLSGNGSITANGAAGSIQWDNGYNGVGGRIAVRVTGEDVGTTGVWTKFAALGCATNQIVADGKVVTADRNQNTSAGTIYLQGKSDGEKGGTIYVRNQKNYDTSNVATWIPAASRGDAAADFANAKLVIADRGVVAIGAAKMKLAELTIEENSLLDLHGEYVRVKRATVGGTRLAGGKYTAATLPKFLKDSGEGGVLDIGGGFSIIVR